MLVGRTISWMASTSACPSISTNRLPIGYTTSKWIAMQMTFTWLGSCHSKTLPGYQWRTSSTWESSSSVTRRRSSTQCSCCEPVSMQVFPMETFCKRESLARNPVQPSTIRMRRDWVTGLTAGKTLDCWKTLDRWNNLWLLEKPLTAGKPLIAGKTLDRWKNHWLLEKPLTAGKPLTCWKNNH